MSLDAHLKSTAKLVHKSLRAWFPTGIPSRLSRSMRYSLFSKGKCLRPILAITVSDAMGGKRRNILPAACALEMIHTYSLIHDDLPSMDDDDMRRGKPSNHRAFDEETAILAGDALQTAAFEILLERTPDRKLAGELALVLSKAAGAQGMVGGQILDLQKNARVEEIHEKKTGALLCAATKMGAVAAGAPATQIIALEKYGRSIGLAFQIVDDILDRSSTTQVLGKTPGKDDQQGKKTFPARFGLPESQKRALSQ
ncbi:MAG: polyprenyl synthetase family protein, partial [Planctomycetota bacterium]|nr:polyprenyl synthetase family protein [Planctomycetota bacterium]